MRAVFEKSIANGSVVAPPSKSDIHRLLISGALSKRSIIRNVLFSNDVLETVECLKALGAETELDDNKIEIGGVDPFNLPEDVCLNCRESASTLRFLIPLLSLTDRHVRIKLSEGLLNRPLSVYKTIYESRSLLFEVNDDSVSVRGPLGAGSYSIPGDVSSQFVSGLLFALPLLDNDSEIEITGKAESASYIGMTVNALRKHNVLATYEGDKLLVKGNQMYVSADSTAEGDYSNASVIDALNLTGGSVTVTGLSDSSLQGDKVYREYFKELSKGNSVIDLSDCIDLAPVMFAVSAFLNDATFINTRRLAYKESDRIASMKQELKKFGADIVCSDDMNTVHVVSGVKKPYELIYGHNDHRIVMALSLLLSITGGEIAGAEAVNKSYPTFFDDLIKIGIRVRLTEE